MNSAMERLAAWIGIIIGAAIAWSVIGLGWLVGGLLGGVILLLGWLVLTTLAEVFRRADALARIS